MLKLIVWLVSHGAGGFFLFRAGALYATEKIFSEYDVIDGDYVPYAVEVIGPTPSKPESKTEQDFKPVEDKKDIEDNPFVGLDVPPISSPDTTNEYRKSFTDYAKLNRNPRVSNDSSNEDINDYREPYIITEQDFENGNRHYDKIFVDYFEDGTFVDEKTDEPDPSIEKYLGVNIVDVFGYGTDDEDMAYIRNERINTDYCVTRKHQTYKEYIGSD